MQTLQVLTVNVSNDSNFLLSFVGTFCSKLISIYILQYVVYCTSHVVFNLQTAPFIMPKTMAKNELRSLKSLQLHTQKQSYTMQL